jgi:hypothetical protein
VDSEREGWWEVRRDGDGELCGYVRRDGTQFTALTVFHAPLRTFDTSRAATQHVHDHGLTSLHQRWRYRPAPDQEWQTVLIQEARPGWVRLVLGYYALAGVPTLELVLGPENPAELRPPD